MFNFNTNRGNYRVALSWAVITAVLLVGAVFVIYKNKNQDETIMENNNIAEVPAAKAELARFATMKTNFGDIKLEFYPEEAPLTVENFIKLSKSGFYDGTKFHRVIKDFMIQGGDPNSKSDDWSTHGMGGPGYSFKDEFNQHKIVRGALAMANSGPNTNGSQFFIVTAEAAPWLDGKHTVFGQVIEGMDIVDKIEGVETNTNDHPMNDIIVEGVVISEE